MANNFVMGATLQLKDMASNTFGTVRKATELFRSTTLAADKATGQYRDSHGKLRNELGQYVTETKRSQTATENYARSATNLSGKLFTLKNAVKAVITGAAMKKGFDWLVGANADMETYKNTLAVVLKSEQEATRVLNWARDFAVKTPFELNEIVEATTRMTAYGLSAEKTLGTVGDMAAVMGKPLMQAMEAIADAQTGELERLKEFGITKGMIEKQAKKMNVNVINTRGQITDQRAFNAALFSLMEERYKGGMEIQAKSFKGQLSMISDFVAEAGRKLGAPIFDAAKAKMADFVAFLGRLEDNGHVDRFVATMQKGGAMIGGVYQTVKEAAGTALNAVSGDFKRWYAENEAGILYIRDTIINRLGTAWSELRQAAAPVLLWIKDVALPGVQKGFAALGTFIVNTTAIFVENWGNIKPFLQGITLALGSYKLYILYTKGIAAATALWAKAQMWLNTSFLKSPTTWTILAIGLLIGALIRAYNTSETFRNRVNNAFSKVVQFAKRVKDAVLNLGDTFTELKDNTISKVQGAFVAFSSKLKEHEDVIKGVAATLGIIFGPALIKTGAEALIAGGKIAVGFIASIVKTGMQATIAAVKLTVSFIAAIVTTGVQATIAAGKITISFIAALLKVSFEAAKTAAIITGRLIMSLVLYAAQGWSTALAIGAQTGAMILNGIQAGLLAIKNGILTAATWTMTAAQWALNAAFIASPIGWVILGIAALIGIGILLVKNWDTIKEKAGALWEGIKYGWDKITGFISGKYAELKESGAKIMDTITEGIKSAAMKPVNAIKGVFEKARALLPFSDAKEGPFSQLTLSGSRIMTTIAEGINRQANAVRGAIDTAFGNTTVAVGAEVGGYNPTVDINPAGGSTSSVTKTIHIEKLVEKIEFSGAGGDDPETFANKFMDIIYEKLKDADDVSGGDKGGIL